jgi:hypothetical protein
VPGRRTLPSRGLGKVAAKEANELIADKNPRCFARQSTITSTPPGMSRGKTVSPLSRLSSR